MQAELGGDCVVAQPPDLPDELLWPWPDSDGMISVKVPRRPRKALVARGWEEAGDDRWELPICGGDRLLRLELTVPRREQRRRQSTLVQLAKRMGLEVTALKPDGTIETRVAGALFDDDLDRELATWEASRGEG